MPSGRCRVCLRHRSKPARRHRPNQSALAPRPAPPMRTPAQSKSRKHYWSLPPPPATTMEPSTTATAMEPSTSGAPRAHAGKSMVAFSAGHPAAVVAPENTMIVRPATLLKSLRTEPLLRLPFTGEPLATRFAAIEATAGLAASRPAGKSFRYTAVCIGHAEPVFRVVSPNRVAERPVPFKMSKSITVEEGMIDQDGPAVPVWRPAPASPAPASPTTEIQSEVDARAPAKADVDSWIEQRRIESIDWRTPHINRIVVRHVPDIGIRRFDGDRALIALIPSRHRSLRSRTKGSARLRLGTHSLNCLHDVLLLGQKCIAQRGGPTHVLAQAGQNLRKRDQSLNAGIPVLLLGFIHQFGWLPFRVIPHPLLGFGDLHRISRGRQYLAQ